MNRVGTGDTNPGQNTRLDERSPALSVVVLCYRSGDSAEDFVERLKAELSAADIDFELVLVGNYVEGTRDPTPEVVTRLSEGDHRIRCSAIPKQGWLGWDVRCGLDLTTGDVVGFIDGDGQVPVSEISRLYRLIASGRFDLVKTYRVTRGDGTTRRILSTIFNVMFHVLFPGSTARDINSKPKLMTRSTYEAMTLSSDDWFIDAEIMLYARRLGLRIGELASDFRGLSGRRSFVGPRAVIEFLHNLARYRWREWRHPPRS